LKRRTTDEAIRKISKPILMPKGSAQYNHSENESKESCEIE
jgi:hypothetical protein